jgi:hypothetical protein
MAKQRNLRDEPIDLGNMRHLGMHHPTRADIRAWP